MSRVGNIARFLASMLITVNKQKYYMNQHPIITLYFSFH
jgi:hypothetical protein